MHFKVKRLLTMFLVGSLFLAGVAAGCGGGDQADNQQGAGGNTSGEEEQAAGGSGGGTGQEGKGAPETKIAVGKIIGVSSERGRFVLKPSRGENVAFKPVPKARIELDDKEAQLANIKKGQQAQIEYVVREGMSVPNRARSITLFGNGAGGGGGTG